MSQSEYLIISDQQNYCAQSKYMMKTSASFRQWAAAISCTLCLSMIGSCFMWITPLMVMMSGPDSPIPMTTTDLSWIASVPELGMICATIPIGLLTDRYGRKKVLMAAGPMVLLSWIFVIYTRSLIILFGVKILQGIAMGIGFVVAPMYIAETSDPKIRGMLSGQFVTMYYMGTLISYCTGPFLSYDNYAIVLSLLPIVFLISFITMPESPYYLLMKNRTEDAYKSLRWLRASDDIEKEFNLIKYSIEEDMKQKGGWKDLIATKADRKALFIVLLVCVIKYMNGMSALTIYASQTIALSTHDLPSNISTIVIGIVLVVTAIISSLLSDSIGRRPLIIISTSGCFLFCALIAIYHFIDGNTSINLTGYSWIHLLSVISFCIISNVGLGPLVQTIQAEYFPSRNRSIGSALAQLVSSLATFCNVKMYQDIADNIGMYFNYIIFSFVSFIGTIILCFTLHETAGKTLGQIQDDLKDDKQTSDVENN